MTLTPSEIRAASFEHARRGYDPGDVDAFLGLTADALEAAEAQLEASSAQLDEARTVESALRNTMLAMSQAREQILDSARAEAATARSQADREAARTLARAEDEAASILMDARRDALDVIAAARADADYLLDAARRAAEPLSEKVEQLRAVVRRTENLMRGLASGALGELSQAHLMLDDAPIESRPEMQIVFTDDDQHGDVHDEVSPLPAAVDRLLSHLREIG